MTAHDDRFRGAAEGPWKRSLLCGMVIPMSTTKETREEIEQRLAQIRASFKVVPRYRCPLKNQEQREAAAELIKQLLAEGRLTNAAFVAACKGHPILNDQFEWNDMAAGEMGREQQAQDIIRHLAFSVEGADGDVIVGVLAPGVQGPDGKYQRVWGPDGLEDRKAMERIFTQALEELKTFIEKLERTEALQGLCAELRALEKRYTMRAPRPDLNTSKK